MKKEFNITETCYADEHYMMDDTCRFGAIVEMMEQSKNIFAVWCDVQYCCLSLRCY